jgi:hypothetical protein
MPYKDLKIRQLKARKYQAAHRAKVKQNNVLNPVEPRSCQLCGISIANKRKDARFCSREHKRITSDMQRDHAVEYQKNAEKRREQALGYYYANHVQSKEQQLARQKANPMKYAAAAAKHRAVKLQRTPSWLDEDALWMIEQAYELAALRTKLFGFSWHVDHVIPLQGKIVSGLHVPFNLQVIPGFQNIAKNNKFEVAA